MTIPSFPSQDRDHAVKYTVLLGVPSGVGPCYTIVAYSTTDALRLAIIDAIQDGHMNITSATIHS